MQESFIGAIGFAAASAVFLALTIIFLARRPRLPGAAACALAALLSAVWGGVWALAVLQPTGPAWPAFAADWVRALAWLAATIVVIRAVARAEVSAVQRSRLLLTIVLLAILPVGYWAFDPDLPDDVVAWVSVGYAATLLAVIGAEQLFRNARSWNDAQAIYFSVAVAGQLLYDLMLFVLALAGAPLDASLLAARGYVAFLFSAPLVYLVWRRADPVMPGRLPRRFTVFTFGTTALALYVVVVIAGYRYVHQLGGSWSTVAAIVVAAAAVAGLAFLLASPSLRSRLRVGLTKTFFQYKYDYRQEWLRFIATLSESGFADVPATSVRAIAQIVGSPGGVLFVEDVDSGDYVPAGAWRAEVPAVNRVAADSGLVRFLSEREWVVDLGELKRSPGRYADLDPGDWLREGDGWWLIVPLFLGRRLLGFVILARPRVAPSLNFEDHDLLKTVGRHVGMHINQAEADRRLAESRQFGAYDRLTAFLMHDLNNLIAQQSLVVKNAERFRDNPKFVDDAIDTIANSVRRMKRLMEQLSRGSKTPKRERVELPALLEQVVQTCANREPVPELRIDAGSAFVEADSDRLASVFEHLIRNAQDATEAGGSIVVEVTPGEAAVEVSITDSGVGMTPEFVRERLFRPFESTKGSGSMGIGAYQAREYLRSIGGQLEVSSTPGQGTRFDTRLPASG